MNPKTIVSIIIALMGATTALPSNSEALSGMPVEKRACEKRITWQGGGCETDWSNHCFDKCYRQDAGKDCCMNTVGSAISSSHCFVGWNTCECSCNKNK